MAVTKGKTGFGVKFAIGNGATPTELFVDVAEVTSINGIGFGRSTVDSTSLESPDEFEEFIAAMKRAKPLTMTFVYVEAGTAHTALLAAFGSDVAKNYRVTWTGGQKYTISALCTDFDFGEISKDSIMTATAVFQPSGKPVFS